MTPTSARHAIRLPGWTGRSDVERVDLYTRVSLHAVFWFLLLMGAASAAAPAESGADLAVVVLPALALGVVATAVVQAALRLHPARGPLPAGLLALLVAGSVAAMVGTLALPADHRYPPTLVVAGILCWACGGFADRRLLAAALVLAAVGLLLATRQPWLLGYGLGFAAFLGFTVQSSLWLLGVVTELDRARGTGAALAVAEERLRFSRDVHDVLGRHLSTIAVQAELAATLAERGDPRAPERVREVRATAHEALREARQLARGYRPLDLAQELDGAVALLRSAGIEVRADRAGLAALPEAWHAPVARVVREAVTNVLRHSAATRVEVSAAHGVVTVRNDGALPARDPGEDGGTGLATLAADLASFGGVLEHAHEDGHFVVRARLGDAPGAAGSTPTPTERTEAAR